MRSSPRWCMLLTSLLLVILNAGDALGETWTEVRSPHFRVVTDGSGKDGRKVANEFEQMRHVFAVRFKDADIESGAPLTILAVSDEGTYKYVDPPLWKSQGDKIAGVFYRHWENQYALVRLDTWGDLNQVVVYHEYTHSILHANVHWLPVWLDEGLAEFYAYTRFQNDRIYIGAPSMRLRVLGNKPLIPVTTMLDVRSPYYHDETKMQFFYAEAWAMVHYMTFGPGMENGTKFNTFFKMLQDGDDQQKAFRDVFGDPSAFDSSFSQYVSRFAYTAAVLPPDHGYDPKTFSERKLSSAEADYEIGCFRISAHDYAGGRTLIEKALALDPNLAAAHEDLGFLDFDEGKDDAAQKEWQQAIKLDPTLARSLFALTMTGPLSGSLVQHSREQLRSVQLTLQHVTQLAPRFAPAYVELALVEWQLNSMQQAYSDAHQAEALEPWRAGYHLLTGHILLHGNQPTIAAAYARYVAKHWLGSDHDEAVDLWQDVPAKMRGEGPALTLDIPAGTEIARGRLIDVSCGAPGAHKYSVTLMPDKSTDSKPLTFTATAPLVTGFSDTLWWGEDHFSYCHHLAGLPAVIGYKQGKQDLELTILEIRDNLPNSNDTVQSAQNAAGAK